MSEEKKFKAYQFDDGTQVNGWCYEKFIDLVMNNEATYDILDVYSRLQRIEVVKDENGFVVDVIQIFPKIDETVVKFANKNFIEFHKLAQETKMTEDEKLESRRYKLQKWWSAVSE